ncbi:MAG: hypothetical protein ACREQZ_11260, partial [Woeseiaceae bacterium]
MRKMTPHTVLIATATSSLLFAACNQSSQPSQANLQDLEQFVDAAMAAGMEEEHIPGAAFILVRD